MKNFINKKHAFSLVEVSVVLLIIGILIAGISTSTTLVQSSQIKSALQLTKSSPVPTIKGLSLWLETCDENSFLNSAGQSDLSNKEEIQTWNDSNPRDIRKNNFTAVSSLKRPTYKKSGINSLPSVNFVRTQPSYMQNTSGIIGLGDTSYTIIIVFRFTTVPTNNWVFLFGQSNSTSVAGETAGIAYNGFSNKIGAVSSGANDYYIIDGIAKKDFIIATSVNGLNADVYGNSKTPQSTTNFNPNLGPKANIASLGSASYNETQVLDGDISEVIIYDHPLGRDDIGDIMDYLSKKYAIKLS